jgi:predicted AAA+ superfamily ATPase
VAVASPFYIERPPIEERCYETITQPGALIRIKAPRQMGKTSLMARILHHAEQQGSRTVALSLQLANQRVFANSDKFLTVVLRYCRSRARSTRPVSQVLGDGGDCWQQYQLQGLL